MRSSYDKTIFKQEYWHAETYPDKLIKIIWYLNQHCVFTERQEKDLNYKDQGCWGFKKMNVQILKA